MSRRRCRLSMVQFSGSYLIFVQTSGEVIDWQKTSLPSAGAGPTCLKRGADSHSTPSRAF